MAKRECIRFPRGVSFLAAVLALITIGGLPGCRDANEAYETEVAQVPDVDEDAEYESVASETEAAMDADPTLPDSTAAELDQEADVLPATATPLPLLGLAGIASLCTALALRLARS